MPLNYPANSGTGDFKHLKPGSHVAVCNLIADLGLQPGSSLYPDPKRQVYIRFEVPAERIEYERDGQKFEGPIVIGCSYTASMHEKAKLRKHLESWRGKSFTDEEAESFDVAAILGKPCMLSVIESVKGDRVYSNISSINSLPKGISAPKPELPLIYYADDDRSRFNDLPDWLKEKITKQLVVEKRQTSAPNYMNDLGITDDDIPF